LPFGAAVGYEVLRNPEIVQPCILAGKVVFETVKPGKFCE
jgi:hypothetical protein